ncbi:GNAT family N-acetyltransferase, partial [Mesorhizobium sp. M00.F.Ca.ET.186.01.1.1]
MRTIPISEEAFLKQLELSDASEMFWLTDTNRSYLKEWLPWLNYTKCEDDTSYFIQRTIQQYDDNQGIHYGIWYNGRMAGTLGVHNLDWINKKTSLGYWLGAGFQGKGLMTKAVAAY